MDGKPQRNKADRSTSWKGVLAQRDAAVRAMAFAVIAVGEVSLAFTQLGFFGIGPANDYAVYAIVLLAPVALGSLLFGLLGGAALGLVAGGALFAHTLLQPLDFYEKLFVTPLSSVALFALTGLVLGALFAVALRRLSRPAARAIAIACVCMLGSVFFGLLFRINVAYEIVSQTLANGLSSSATSHESATLVIDALGRFDVQTIVDAAVMAVVCIAVDVMVRRVAPESSARSLRTTFRAWLFGAALIAFMCTEAVSFVVVTEQEKASASVAMGDEAAYICRQLDRYEARAQAIDALVQEAGISEDLFSLDDLRAAASAEDLLDGYSIEFDGFVNVLHDGEILLSDDLGTPAGGRVADYFDGSVSAWFASAAQTGEMAMLLYDVPAGESGASDGAAPEGDTTDDSPSTLQVVCTRVAQTGDYTVLVSMPSSMVFAARAGVMTWTTLLAVVLLAAVFVVASRLLARIVVRRIDEANDVLARIEEGDLATRVHICDSKELSSLSDGINSTVDALERRTAEAESRFDAELTAAKAIQESALPRTFPPFPDILRFDIYAAMKPARQVGGDFYDFFLIEGARGATEVAGTNEAAMAERAVEVASAETPSAATCALADGARLGFVIADVSGKGVPAALFMMAAKSQIKQLMETGMALGEALENANRRLCEGNDASMFVTVFAGVLDYRTGRLSYANAGHNPPLLWQRGAWRLLDGKSGLPLGLFSGLSYRTFECTCGIGDQLLLYTDGVTEAMNESGALYGFDRLRNVVDANYTSHPRMLIEAVRDDVSAFAGQAEQADDITLLALEYGVPPEITSTMVVPADDAELSRVTEFVHTELDRRLCPLRAQRQLDIAIEELFVNVAHYAYPDATPDHPGMVRISYTYSAEPPSIAVEIADEGVSFDPLSRPDVVMSDNALDVQIGGLGILMARKSVDEMTYRRDNGFNVVTVKKRW